MKVLDSSGNAVCDSSSGYVYDTSYNIDIMSVISDVVTDLVSSVINESTQYLRVGIVLDLKYWVSSVGLRPRYCRPRYDMGAKLPCNS